MTANVDSIGWLASEGTPWHGLGNALTGDESRDELLRKCGLDWQYVSRQLYYCDEHNLQDHQPVQSHKATVRSDTGDMIGIVGSRFRYVQPSEVVDTFLGVADANDLQIAVAGALDGGRRIWALARIGDAVELPGRDRVEPYALLATANDGTMATRAKLTMVRVVCANTWHASGIQNSAVVSIRHNSAFDQNTVRDGLGLSGLWTEQKKAMRAMADRSVTQDDTFQFLTTVFGDPTKPITDEDQPHKRAMREVWRLTQNGRGAQLTSAASTAWGLFNAVTEYTDHCRRAQSTDNRLTSSWFGDSAAIKEKAYAAAMALAA